MRLRAPSHAQPNTLTYLTGVPLAALAIGGVLASSLGARAVNAAGSAAFIRVNQLGYATTAAKRAYLMASGSEAGATFSVRNSGGTLVATGAVGASLG